MGKKRRQATRERKGGNDQELHEVKSYFDYFVWIASSGMSAAQEGLQKRIDVAMEFTRK